MKEERQANMCLFHPDVATIFPLLSESLTSFGHWSQLKSSHLSFWSYMLINY